jgi:hypothetical protein
MLTNANQFIEQSEAAIDTERKRQIQEKRWTFEHDDLHTDRSLSLAAKCYEQNARLMATYEPGIVPQHWPWHRDEWNPKTAERDLIRAGALYQAEIERLIRAKIEVPRELEHWRSQASMALALIYRDRAELAFAGEVDRIALDAGNG